MFHKREKIKLSIDLNHFNTLYIHGGHNVFYTDKQEDIGKW